MILFNIKLQWRIRRFDNSNNNQKLKYVSNWDVKLYKYAVTDATQSMLAELHLDLFVSFDIQHKDSEIPCDYSYLIFLHCCVLGFSKLSKKNLTNLKILWFEDLYDLYGIKIWRFIIWRFIIWKFIIWRFIIWRFDDMMLRII